MKKFVAVLQKFYVKSGRHSLPWRQFDRPLPIGRQAYKILVSEIMLQQTQVERVLPKYKQFIKQFPTARALAAAHLPEVLKAWQGLGYNRRAKYLHQAAKIISREGFIGQKLPGVGPYTAGAILAFAFNKPEVFIETNIRTVFLQKITSLRRDKPHSSAKQFSYGIGNAREAISDSELLPLVENALNEATRQGMQPRDFYAALMDYGSHLKKNGITLNSHSKHYSKQSKFEGSTRQLRGAILRELLQKPMTLAQLTKNLSRGAEEVERQLHRLELDELILFSRSRWRVAD